MFIISKDQTTAVTITNNSESVYTKADPFFSVYIADIINVKCTIISGIAFSVNSINSNKTIINDMLDYDLSDLFSFLYREMTFGPDIYIGDVFEGMDIVPGDNSEVSGIDFDSIDNEDIILKSSEWGGKYVIRIKKEENYIGTIKIPEDVVTGDIYSSYHMERELFSRIYIINIIIIYLYRFLKKWILFDFNSYYFPCIGSDGIFKVYDVYKEIRDRRLTESMYPDDCDPKWIFAKGYKGRYHVKDLLKVFDEYYDRVNNDDYQTRDGFIVEDGLLI